MLTAVLLSVLATGDCGDAVVGGLCSSPVADEVFFSSGDNELCDEAKAIDLRSGASRTLTCRDQPAMSRCTPLREVSLSSVGLSARAAGRCQSPRVDAPPLDDFLFRPVCLQKMELLSGGRVVGTTELPVCMGQAAGHTTVHVRAFAGARSTTVVTLTWRGNCIEGGYTTNRVLPVPTPAHPRRGPETASTVYLEVEDLWPLYARASAALRKAGEEEAAQRYDPERWSTPSALCVAADSLGADGGVSAVPCDGDAALKLRGARLADLGLSASVERVGEAFWPDAGAPPPAEDVGCLLRVRINRGGKALLTRDVATVCHRDVSVDSFIAEGTPWAFVRFADGALWPLERKTATTLAKRLDTINPPPAGSREVVERTRVERAAWLATHGARDEALGVLGDVLTDTPQRARLVDRVKRDAAFASLLDDASLQLLLRGEFEPRADETRALFSTAAECPATP